MAKTRGEFFKWRIKALMPLFFPFILTLLPFLVLKYNQDQEKQIKFERKRTYWELEANNRIQLFRSHFSLKNQLTLRTDKLIGKLKEECLKNGKLINSNAFTDIIKNNFTGVFMPETIYAGVIKKGKLKLFQGPAFGKNKKFVVKKIFSKLAEKEIQKTWVRPPLGASRKIPLYKSELDKWCKKFLGQNVSFNMLKKFLRGKIFDAIFEGRSKLAVWDIIDAGSEGEIVYLMTFSKERTSSLDILKLALREVGGLKENFIPILVPLDFADNSLKVIMNSKCSAKIKVPLIKLLKEIRAKPFLRDKAIPNSMFVIRDGMRIVRDFVDYSVPYEIWLVGDDNDFKAENLSIFVFVLTLAFFAGWTGAFARVLITGQRLSLSLRAWLNILFLIIGIFPLTVLYVAGTMQISASSFKREQKAIRDTLQRLEEADSSGESVITEYREACRQQFMSKSWRKAFLTKDKKLWLEEANKVEINFNKMGLALTSLCAFWPENSKFNSILYNFENNEDAYWLEERAKSFYTNWVKKSYFKVGRAAMKGIKEEELPFFSGETGEAMILFFLAHRADVEIIEVGDKIFFVYFDYILENGLPRNWFFFKANISNAFERFLIKSMENLQQTFIPDITSKATNADLLANKSLNFLNGLNKISNGFDPNITYGLSRIERGDYNEILHKDKKDRSSLYLEKYAKKWMTVSAKTKARLVKKKDGGIVVTYPCKKSGPYILTCVYNFNLIKEDALKQELALRILVVLLAFPVLLLAHLLASYLVVPLKKVEQGLKKIGEEDFSVKLHIDRKDEIGVLTAAFDKMCLGLQERKNLGRFVSASLDMEISKDQELLTTGLGKEFGAVLCSDIRDFTTLSEAFQARDIVEMLNSHLSKMSDCIRSEGGMVEQFIGDAILAVFVGETMVEASKKALRAAERMNRVHYEINQDRKLKGIFSYRIGIGIDVGELLAGTLNVASRREYLVVGQARNKSEVLEGVSKIGRFSRIIVSEKVKNLLEELKFVELSEDSWELVEEQENLK